MRYIILLLALLLSSGCAMKGARDSDLENLSDTEAQATVTTGTGVYASDWAATINSNITQVDGRLDALESGKVATTGNETIAGIKTFSSSPIVPTPTTNYQAATKAYVDNSSGSFPGFTSLPVDYGFTPGTAATRNAEDTLTDGANLPDGAAIKAYGDANWGGGSMTYPSIDSLAYTTDGESWTDVFIDIDASDTASTSDDTIYSAKAVDGEFAKTSDITEISSYVTQIVASNDKAAVLALLSPPVISKSTAYTIGTDDASECYGGTVHVTAAATMTACDGLADGMRFAVVSDGANAVSVDTQSDDRMKLAGFALDDGDKATSGSNINDTLYCEYESAAGWYCWKAGTWTDGGQ